jgi:hypothetical protein
MTFPAVRCQRRLTMRNLIAGKTTISRELLDKLPF